MIAGMYTLSNYHHQVGSMNYNPLFMIRSCNNGMRCMSLYISMKEQLKEALKDFIYLMVTITADDGQEI